jgi:hypothetical protein
MLAGPVRPRRPGEDPLGTALEAGLFSSFLARIARGDARGPPVRVELASARVVPALAFCAGQFHAR